MIALLYHPCMGDGALVVVGLVSAAFSACGLWAFCSVLLQPARRWAAIDRSKGGWIAVVVLVPFGWVFYLLTIRPKLQKVGTTHSDLVLTETEQGTARKVFPVLGIAVLSGLLALLLALNSERVELPWGSLGPAWQAVLVGIVGGLLLGLSVTTLRGHRTETSRAWVLLTAISSLCLVAILAAGGELVVADFVVVQTRVALRVLIFGAVLLAVAAGVLVGVLRREPKTARENPGESLRAPAFPPPSALP